MKSKTKKQILSMLAKHLRYFKPHLSSHFVCPTCLSEIPIKDTSNISVAHIVPRAAGGNLTTFICKQCNDTFGYKQDRWFGDFLNICNSPHPDIFSSKNRPKNLEICGIKVNGSWKITDDGGLTFYITNNDARIEKAKASNNEQIHHKKLIKALHDKTRPREIKIKFPILTQQNSINTGFLTAAYLMWFRAFGYSWVFQKHLDIVRKQIANPDKIIIPFNYCIYEKGLSMPLWYGLIPSGETMIPAMGLSNAFVFLPQRSIANFYETIADSGESFDPAGILDFTILKTPKYGPPLGVLFENNAIIDPNLATDSLKSMSFLLYHRDNNKPEVLHPISDDESESLKKQKNVVSFKTKIYLD